MAGILQVDHMAKQSDMNSSEERRLDVNLKRLMIKQPSLTLPVNSRESWKRLESKWLNLTEAYDQKGEKNVKKKEETKE